MNRGWSRLRLLFVAWTIGATALGVLSLAGTFRLPFVVAVLLLLGYLGLIGVGVAFPASGIFGPAIGRGRKGRGQVALTFDDGPHPTHTRRVLAVLEAHGARATFFVVGTRAEQHADLVREIRSRGHEVGSHSYGHSHLFAMLSRRSLADDFQRARRVLEPLLGDGLRYFRPPVGLTNPRIARAAAADGLTVVAWSVRSRDGVPWARAETIRRRLRRRVEAGDVVILHDRARGDRAPAAVEALEGILLDLRGKSLSSVTLSELFSVPAEPPTTPDRS